MIPAAFEYRRPETVGEAIELLGELGEDGKILAGGHSLIPLMRLRLAQPSVLIDLGRIEALRGVRREGDELVIGAMTTHDTLESSSAVRSDAPMLAHTAGRIGDMQVRNRGTIGGSLAHADPASDLPCVVSALNASIVATGPRGSRRLPATEFFLDLWTTALEIDEMVTEVRVPIQADRRGSYHKYRHRVADWAIVGVAANLRLRGEEVLESSVFIANVSVAPVRASHAEASLTGRHLSSNVIAAAAREASDGLDPSPELKASPEYKRHLTEVLMARVLTDILSAT